MGNLQTKEKSNNFFSFKKPNFDLLHKPSTDKPKKPQIKKPFKRLLTIADDYENNPHDQSSEFSEFPIVNEKESEQTSKKMNIIYRKPLIKILKPLNISRNMDQVLSATFSNTPMMAFRAKDNEKNNYGQFLTSYSDEYLEKMRHSIEKNNKKKAVTDSLINETTSKNQSIKNKNIATRNNKGNQDLTKSYTFNTYYDRSVINFKNSVDSTTEKHIDTDQSLLCSLRTTNSSSSFFRTLIGDNEILPQSSNKSKMKKFKRKMPRGSVDSLGERLSPILERVNPETPLETIFEKMKPTTAKKKSSKLLNKISLMAEKKCDILINNYAPSSFSNEKKINLSIANKNQNKLAVQSDDEVEVNKNLMKLSSKGIAKGFLIKRNIKIKLKTEVNLSLNKSPKNKTCL